MADTDREPDAQPGKGTGKLELPSWRSIVAALLLVTGGTALTQVDTSIKKLIDDWFSSCRIVIGQSTPEKLESGDYLINVMTYATGKAPETLRIAFATTKPILESVTLVRNTSGSNLALHPDSGKGCPGQLCASQPVKQIDAPPRFKDIKVDISPYRSIFDLTFKVLLRTESGAAPASGALDAYIHYPKELPNTVCPVEPRSIFNGLVWMSAFWKFVVLAGMFLLLTFVVALVRKLTSAS